MSFFFLLFCVSLFFLVFTQPAYLFFISLHLDLSLSVSFNCHVRPLYLSVTRNIKGGAATSAMAEGGVGTFPQVFVVDSQVCHVSVPGLKKEGWVRRLGQKFLPLLVGFTMLGLVVEACLIYNLYKKIEVSLEYMEIPS